MKKRIVGYILLLAVILLCLTGCSNVNVNMVEQEASTPDTSMFVVIEHSYTTYSSWDVVYHRETKVMYLINCHGGSQTMVNADGTPMIYEMGDN